MLTSWRLHLWRIIRSVERACFIGSIYEESENEEVDKLARRAGLLGIGVVILRIGVQKRGWMREDDRQEACPTLKWTFWFSGTTPGRARPVFGYWCRGDMTAIELYEG